MTISEEQRKRLTERVVVQREYAVFFTPAAEQEMAERDISHAEFVDACTRAADVGNTEGTMYLIKWDEDNIYWEVLLAPDYVTHDAAGHEIIMKANYTAEETDVNIN